MLFSFALIRCANSFFFYTSVFAFQAYDTSQHKLGQSGFYRFVALSFLFKTLKRRFWHWRWRSIAYFSCYYVLFLLKTHLKVCNSTRSLLSQFPFQNSPHVLHWGQVRDAGSPVHCLYPLRPQLNLCNVFRTWFCLVGRIHNIETSMENMLSWKKHMLLLNLSVAIMLQ